jgi:glycerophosphoryl diester phosphodiesterase
MTKIIGHRGGRNLWPENSLTGFRAVLDLAVDAVEFDVHLTDAGELVVIHDPRLDRTTSASGLVRALTPESRQRAFVHRTDEPVPTLDEVLTVLVRRPDLELHVELKSDEDERPYPGLIPRVLGTLSRFGAAGRTHLTSFDTTVLEACRQLAPNVPRLVSVNADWAHRQGGLSRFLDDVADFVDIVAVEHQLLAGEWELVTSRVPAERLCVWTVNDAETVAAFLARGVGHLTSDSPDIALAVRDDEA